MSKTPLESINTAERETLLHIFEETNRALEQSVDTLVSELEEIENPQTKRYVVAFFDKSIKQLGRHMLEHQYQASTHVRQIANAYRARVHIDV
jgi:hypothetical protein